MSDSKDTKYNNLQQAFNKKRTDYDQNKTKELVKADNHEEFIIKRTEKQQTMYLQNQTGTLNRLIGQNNLTHEGTRQAAYSDFEQMEYYPILSKALDLYAEESTTKNRDGKILNIFSENSRVQKILEDLFYNRLHISTNLPMWIRNTCKTGDNMVYLNMDDKLGITSSRQLPNIEIERKEGGVYNSNNQFVKEMTKFVYRGNNVEFFEWQIAHFRLLFDDRRIPYGVSMLEKVRRLWRNLIIAEDAMLTYRVVRAPERRVFKIYVGNLNPVDIEPYINKVMDKIKRKPQFGGNGQYNSKYNVMSIDDDYVIPVRNSATESSVETLAGASNMGDIADIEYLKNDIYAALGIPAAYLNFGEGGNGGDGKSLAMLDSRFGRTISRIQEAVLTTLNKIATTHLYLLGLEDELGNFVLTLNNPSIQTDILWVEYQNSLMNLFREATTKNDSGFSPMSNMMAMQKILGMSEQEIIENFEQQRIEKAASLEMEITGEVIKKSGLFDRIDKLYGDPNSASTELSDVSSDGGLGGSSGGGGGFSGGGGLGGDFGGGSDLGDDIDGGGDLGSDLGSEVTGGEDFSEISEEPEIGDIGGGIEDINTIEDSFKHVYNKVKNMNKNNSNNIITENNDILSYNNHANMLKEQSIGENLKTKNKNMQEDIKSVIEDLQKFTSEYDKITKE